MRIQSVRSVLSAKAVLLGCVLAGVAAHAGAATVTSFSKGVTTCAAGDCTWSLSVDGAPLMSGMYQSAADGSLSLMPGDMTRVDLPDGGFIAIDGVSGNIDPILGFNISAGTAATGRSFSFAFSLPIALSGFIQADSSVSYSLTALTAAGAQVQPLFGKTVVAQEVDSTPGGLVPLNKGVDVGNRFFFLGGPQTQNSPVYTASSTFVGDAAYDLMSVTVAFALSPNSNVGMSGFVQQVDPPAPVPEPSAAVLLLAGALLLARVAGRTASPDAD